MRYMKIDKTMPGMTVGKDVVDSNNRILFRNGAVLTEIVIKLLKKSGFDYLYISDELTNDVEAVEVLPPDLKNSIYKLIQNKNVEAVIDSAKIVVDKVLDSENLSASVYDKSDNKFAHSLSVAEIAVSIGKHLGYNQERLQDLAASCMLEDIGKLCDDNDELLKKCNVSGVLKSMGINIPMNEYDDKMHPYYSYRMISENSLVRATIKQSLLMHHENYDGTGLFKLSGEKIYEYARIIRVADVFSSIISSDENEYNLSDTSEIIEFMSNQSEKMFDKNIVSILVNKIPIYPPGITVTLQNGMKAVVAAQNPGSPSRPIIILEGGQKIDLLDKRFLTLKIVSINDNEVIEKGKQL